MSYRLPYVKELAFTCNCAVLMLSYRGYGESLGSPSQAGFEADAQLVMDFVLERRDLSSSIVLFGRSLGGAVAIHLAARNPGKVAAAIIENTFTSVGDMAGELMPFLRSVVGRGRPLNVAVWDKWENIRAIPRIRDVPTLMLSSGMDEMVPPAQMRELYSARGAELCTWHFFPEGRHLTLYESHRAEYWSVMKAFMAQLFS